jgi:hypothetical protein
MPVERITKLLRYLAVLKSASGPSRVQQSGTTLAFRFCQDAEGTDRRTPEENRENI